MTTYMTYIVDEYQESQMNNKYSKPNDLSQDTTVKKKKFKENMLVKEQIISGLYNIEYSHIYEC